MQFSGGVVVALIADVAFHPVQVTRAEADHAVTHLPLEHFATQAELVIDTWCDNALFNWPTNSLINSVGGAQRYMNVGFRAADFMHKRPGVLIIRCLT